MTCQCLSRSLEFFKELTQLTQWDNGLRLTTLRNRLGLLLWRYHLCELRNIEVRYFWNMDARNSVDNTCRPVYQLIKSVNHSEKQDPSTPFMASERPADSIAYRHLRFTKNTNHFQIPLNSPLILQIHPTIISSSSEYSTKPTGYDAKRRPLPPHML